MRYLNGLLSKPFKVKICQKRARCHGPQGQLYMGPTIEEVERKANLAFEDPKLARKAALYVCHRYSGMSLKEIGAHFGIGESGISRNSSRFHLLLEKEHNAIEKLRQLKKVLNLSNA